MGFLLDWLHALISLVLLLALAELLLPDGSMRPYVRVILGVVLAVAVIRPFVQLGAFQWSLPALTLPPPPRGEPVAEGRRLALALQDRARREAEGQAALQAARLVELRLGVRPAATTVELAPDGWVESIHVSLGEAGQDGAVPAPAGGDPANGGDGGAGSPPRGGAGGTAGPARRAVAVSVAPVDSVKVVPFRVGEGPAGPPAGGGDPRPAPQAPGGGDLREQVRALLAGFYQVPADRVQVEP
ncbi:stage III sporulation protein AF [Limnochorda pilosa]|uniref:stage III sporulation protein AF n=1 Tax=Limnochorda pilosa TaxID=1555112 RepID=UPI00130EAA3B|nr:stage III sporulation protein AF [Limnochorda pilosa]